MTYYSDPFSLAVTAHQAGRLAEAEQLYRQVLAQDPKHADALHRLGGVAFQTSRPALAVDLIGQALALRPNWPEACSNLGNALREIGRTDDAIVACRKAIALRPGYPIAHNNLANALADKGELDAAIAAYRQAIALRPDYLKARTNLASVLKDAGDLDAAIAEYRHVLRLNPADAETHSNLLLLLNYHADTTPESLWHETQRWATQHAAPLARCIQPHTNDRSPDRRLRVGYISHDLRQHVVAKALLPYLAHHDHGQFEIFCYAQVQTPDAMTQRLAAHADTWRSIVGRSDEAVAAQIRDDRIDILVDLAGHTTEHRLLVMAHKPAPVQISWLGYPGTTGVGPIDYLITKPAWHGPDSDLTLSERPLYLADTLFCYDPCAPTPEVAPPPALATGRVTFGCLNNPCKFTPPALAAWIQILRAVPNSDLLLFAHPCHHRQRLRDILARESIDPERLRFVGWGGPRYLELFQQLDIALDPFPFTGSTSTCDALWMGVPVVTRTGPLVVSRLSFTVLSCLNLPELIAATPDDYIRIATTLAADLPRLAHLRATLRQRMQDSPLMDAPRFARELEAAYRRAWQNWCVTP